MFSCSHSSTRPVSGCMYVSHVCAGPRTTWGGISSLCPPLWGFDHQDVTNGFYWLTHLVAYAAHLSNAQIPFIIQLCFSDFLSEHFLYSFFHLLITEWIYLNQFTYFTVYSNWKEDIIENFKLIVNLLRTYIHERNWGKAVLKIRSASYISYITSQRSSFALYSSHDVQAV